MSFPRIEARDINRSYGDSSWQLGPLNLSFGNAPMTGIIGPNGSGKSTLLGILSRSTNDFSGTVTYEKQNISAFDNRSWAREVGYLPQSISTQFDFTVEETVAFGRYPYTGFMGFMTERDHEAVSRSMQETDILHVRHRRITTLSGGERQRVMLASVLAQEPRVLFLDEPTTSLDIHHQVLFYQALCQCCERGIMCVLATHDLTLASHFCTKLVLLANGKIAAEGTPQDVLTAERIKSVYGESVDVEKHPRTGRPIVLPGLDD